jgi:serine/threonine protein kinase
MSRTSNPRAKRTIGKYHIVAKLAEGAMSAVYKAHDASTGATVAIKVASAALTRDPVMVKRFEQEYRSTSNLCHPNIVRGLEFGWEGNRPYIVMELVDGEDMWTRIERLGKLTEAEAIDYIAQIGQGLHEAHKNGIIHRDIKPDNILLTADGQAKLTDLGLSKDLEQDLGLTRDDRGLGTPNFIAPEQFGDAKHAGVRCDIYALGATLYMALTGKLPFEAPSMSQTLKRKLANDLIPPRKLVPTLSERVDWAVRRAVQPEPERRFGSCPEFISALTGEVRGETAGSHDAAALAAAASAPRPPRGTVKRPDKDRRGAVRYDCALPISCTINLSVHDDVDEWQTKWDAQVVNLSITGIGLLLPRRFEPRTVLTVALTSTDGRVTRCRDMEVVRVVRTDRGAWYLGGTLSEKLSREELRQLL